MFTNQHQNIAVKINTSAVIIAFANHRKINGTAQSIISANIAHLNTKTPQNVNRSAQTIKCQFMDIITPVVQHQHQHEIRCSSDANMRGTHGNKEVSETRRFLQHPIDFLVLFLFTVNQS